MKLTVTTCPLSRRIVAQFDHATNQNCTKADQAICRVRLNNEELVLIQGPAGVFRITGSNYLNQGWDRTFGALDTIPKAIFTA